MLPHNEFSTKVGHNAGLKALGVSLRFYPQPEDNAFRLIKRNRCNNYYLFNLLSGTLSNALRLILKSEFDAPLEAKSRRCRKKKMSCDEQNSHDRAKY